MITHPKYAARQRAEHGEVAGFYPDLFDPLSNFWAGILEWPMVGQEYFGQWPTVLGQTSEHIYQWARFVGADEEIAEAVLAARSAHAAKRLARQHLDRQRDDWPGIRVGIMRSICEAKLAQHPYVAEILEGTGDAEIIEASPKDAFWGWGPADERGNHNGQNMLGEIWMDLRKRQREGKIITL